MGISLGKLIGDENDGTCASLLCSTRVVPYHWAGFARVEPVLGGWLPSKRRLLMSAGFLVGWYGLTHHIIPPFLMKYTTTYATMSPALQQCVLALPCLACQ